MVFDLVVRVVPPQAVGAASGKLEVQHLMRVDRYEVYRSCQPIERNTAIIGPTLRSVGAEACIELCVPWYVLNYSARITRSSTAVSRSLLPIDRIIQGWLAEIRRPQTRAKMTY